MDKVEIEAILNDLNHGRGCFKDCIKMAETAVLLYDRVESAKNLFDSITCLCAEGVEFHKQGDIIKAVSKEAVEGYLLCGREFPK